MLCHYKLKICPKYGAGWLHTATESFHSSGGGTQHLLRQLPWTCVLAQDLRSSMKNVQQCAMKIIRWDLGGRRCPLSMSCWVCSLLCAETGQRLTDCGVICALKVEVLWGRGTLLPSPVRGRKKFLLNHISHCFSQEAHPHYDFIGPPLYTWPIINGIIVIWCMIVVTTLSLIVRHMCPEPFFISIKYRHNN